jgi:hypothetical protein
MATVNKDFRVKHGLVVEGTNATVDGSDIITEDAIVGGTQTNITVTYNPTTKVVDFVAENGVSDSTTDDLVEGDDNLYFTDQRAIDAVGGSATSDNTPNTVVKRNEEGDFAAENITVEKIKASDGTTVFNSGGGNGKSVSVDFISAGFGSGGTTISEDMIQVNETRTNVLAKRGTGSDVYLGDNSTADNLIATKGNIETHSDATTGVHGVTGDVVGTTDTQDLSNKRVIDTLYFTDGVTIANEAEVAVKPTTHEFEIKANYGNLDLKTVATGADVNITSQSGDIILNADGTSYINTASAGNQIATTGNIEDHSDLTTGVHGVSGDVVGTSDAQTLTNKTMGDDLLMDGNQVSGLGTPTQADHAATKSYVDNTATGIVTKPQVLGATSANINATYDNGDDGVGATLTFNSNGVFPAEAAGATGWAVGKGILVKNQTDKAQNGRYVIADMGSVSTPYVLRRCSLCDEASEIPGAYIFVQDGNLGGTGWIQVVSDPATFVVGTDDIDVFQFSGEGTYTAGNGLELSGTTFSIDETITATRTYVEDNFVALDDLPGQLDDYIPLTQKAENNGVATLDNGGDVPSSQLGNINSAVSSIGLTPFALTINAGGYYGQNDGSETSIMRSATERATISGTTKTHVSSLFQRASKMVVTATHGSNVQATEILVIQDGSNNIYMTEYASICSAATDLVAITVEYDTIVDLQYVYATPANSGTTTVVINHLSIGAITS